MDGLCCANEIHKLVIIFTTKFSIRINEGSDITVIMCVVTLPIRETTRVLMNTYPCAELGATCTPALLQHARYS